MKDNSTKDNICKGNTLQDVLYMRCFAVISLVAWHSYCTYICWGYGDSPLDGVYGRLFRFFTPDANMPLFTFLAGYLFCFLLNKKNKYPNFKDFLKNKVHRLLIPFLVLGTLTNLTQINNRFIDIFYGKPSHLWYCLMLFYCYIACWLLERWGGKKINIIVMALSCLVVIMGFGGLSYNSPFGWRLPIHYYCYFYIGFLVFNSRDKILGLLRKYWILVFVLFIFLSVFFHYRWMLFQHIAYIALIFLLFNNIAELTTPKFLFTHNYIILITNSISKCSMGIYVFHQWIIWNLSASGIIKSFINEHYIIFPLLCWILVFLVSWGLTYLSITYSKVGKYLLT